MSEWPDDEIATVDRLWREGKSGTEIGKTLTRTRCAVLGLIHRMKRAGVEFPERGPRPPARPQMERYYARKAAKAAAEAREGGPKIATMNGYRRPRSNPVPPTPDVDLGFSRPWTERAFNECSWPIGGEGADTLSCCAPVKGRGWCAYHLEVGTKPAPPLKDLFRSVRRAA